MDREGPVEGGDVKMTSLHPELSKAILIFSETVETPEPDRHRHRGFRGQTTPMPEVKLILPRKLPIVNAFATTGRYKARVTSGS